MVNSGGRAGDVRFQMIPTPTGGSYVGGMVAQGVSKDCIFTEDFGDVFKSAISAVVFKLRQQTWPCQRNHFRQSWSLSTSGVPLQRREQNALYHCRDIVGQLIRFLTGHAFLKRHNAVVFHGISPPPGDVTCRLCKDPFSEETPHHIVTECEYLCAWRYETMGALLLDGT